MLPKGCSRKFCDWCILALLEALRKELSVEQAATYGSPVKGWTEPASSDPWKVVSLFSGCGGMDLGFLGGFETAHERYDRLPFEIVWANDVNVAACDTYRLNFERGIVCGDIRGVINLVPDSGVDVLIGGFPCQDISVNGLRKGVDGEKSGLYRAMVEAVNHCRPRVFVAENVGGLLLNYNRESLERVIADFGALGYEIEYQLYNAADYGVPQKRERVFIVGTRPGSKQFEPPRSTAAEWVTSREAIGDLEDAQEDHSINHVWSRAARSPDQGTRMIRADSPSETIRAEHHGNIQFHYCLPRRLSLREAARLQTFPDSFRFPPKRMRETERQIGNAVPPVLAWHIANAVRECLA